MIIRDEIIDKAIEALENDGIIFEDSSDIGIYLKASPSRNELERRLKEHFNPWGDSVLCTSISIPDDKEWKYLIYMPRVFETEYSNYNSIEEAIITAASSHYEIDKSKISFDYI